MDLAKSFGGLTPPTEPKPSEDQTRTPEPVQAIPHAVQMAAARKVAAEPKAATARPQQVGKQRPEEPQASTRGKSSNPDYEAVKVLVKTEYRTKATRKWEDEHGRGRDFSDLIEQLLRRYIGA